MKKLLKLAAILTAAITITACGSLEVTEEITREDADFIPEETSAPLDEDIVVIEEMIETKVAIEKEKQQEESVEMVIYHSNGTADGLEKEIIYTDEITAEKLLTHLAVKNIVSIDTRLSSFAYEETQGGRTAYLDLSKAFKEYIKTMGSEGEAVIIAALANTFLDNFKAQKLVLTIEGEVLETGHGVYEEPIDFMEIEGVSKDV